MRPHAAPSIFVVDAAACANAARTTSERGSASGGAAYGSSRANTSGNPPASRRRWIRATTGGAGGKTRSKNRKIADRCTCTATERTGLLASMLPTSHTIRRATTTAITTPRLVSTDRPGVARR